MKPLSIVLFFLLTLTSGTAAAQDKVASIEDAPETKGAFQGSKLMYTTYFYTAAEAVVHGYEKDTRVRIVDLAQNRTVWSGKVQPGQTKLIPTGKGVFGFMSDRKAAILVGTPSSCTAVGYWLRDQNGSHLSSKFFTQLPSSISQGDARVIAWAWEPLNLSVTDATGDALLARQKLDAGDFFEIDATKLGSLNSHVLNFQADSPHLSVQVYYDEGFFVPSKDGRVAGKIFRTYVGAITEGLNDLNLVNQGRDTRVRVKDIKSGEMIWSGKVPRDGVHTLTLSKRYVEVTSDDEISVSVAPREHRRADGYAEHHFAAGVEGTGIENRFLTSTPRELWIFSYFDRTEVTVRNMADGKTVWKGNLDAGHVKGLMPGMGTYQVTTSQGTSVMGGASACGAEYSPAGGLFRVDEELLKMARVILEERKARAREEGRTLTADEAAAPLSQEENRRAREYIEKNLGKSMSAPEVQQRIDDMVTY